MTKKKFTIDVEETTQENALFEDDKFVCFEGDTDEYLKKINEMSNEIEQLKEQNQRLSEQKHIYKQDWKHLCIDKELLDSENEELKKENKQLKLQNQRLDIDIKNNQLAYYDLENENEQLKNENQKLDEKICLHTMDLIKTKSYEQLEKELNRIKNENEGLKSENEDMRRLINNISHQRDEFHHGARENANRVGKLKKENEKLKQDLEGYCNFSLHDVLDKKNKKIERLQSTLAYRSNQLALMEQLIDDLGHEEMKRQMEEILND